MRVAKLLVTAAIAALARAAAPPQDVSQRTNVSPARFFLPEERQNEHKLLLEVLETLGIERFVPPNSQDQAAAAQDPLHLWSLLPNASTHVNLVWSVTGAPPYAQLRFPQPFRARLNHLPGAERLTSNDALAQHIQQRQLQHGRFYFNFVPDHFVLPRDHARMAQAFPAILKKVEFELKRERDWFIYQRFLLRKQPTSDDERAATPAQVFVSAQELTQMLATQFDNQTVEVASYIEPLLLDGHKFRVGFYVAITSLDPLRVYVFSHADVKIASVLYPRDVNVATDRRVYTFDQSYLRAWDFPDLQPLFRAFPSTEHEGTNAWRAVKRYLRAQGLDTTRLQHEITDAIVRVIASSRGHFQAEVEKLRKNGATDSSDRFFELWKMEFEIDDASKPWLVDVHANPSLAAEQTTFGTDEAIKRRLLLDLLTMLQVDPRALQSFDAFVRSTGAAGAVDSQFCRDKCSDTLRVWDTSCWSCAGWFDPPVARRLFTAMHEYTRRGRFDLVFPALAKDHSRFLDPPVTQHDVAFDRYIKSLASGYAEQPLTQDRSVVCVYRDHCSHHGDCVNGACKCDAAYEGTTCYIPKDLEQQAAQDGTAAAGAAAARDAPTHETWKERVGQLWRPRSPAPAMPPDNADTRQNAAADAEAQTTASSLSLAKIGFGLVMAAAFLLAAYRVCAAYAPTSHDRKSN